MANPKLARRRIPQRNIGALYSNPGVIIGSSQPYTGGILAVLKA